MDFLPQDYEAPKSNSNYMKIQDGENRIRILSSPILGWEDWKDKKPVRFRMNNKPEKPNDPTKPVLHFWAMVVWNYPSAAIQILQIKQATIRKRIEDLSKDKDWGAPYNYDIKIVKTGSDQQTKYAVNPVPSREVDPYIKDAFYKTPIDLEELFRGGDPFVVQGEFRTRPFWESKPKTEEIVEEIVTRDQAAEIEGQITKYIDPNDRFWRESALKAFKISSFSELKKRHYDLMISRIAQKKKDIENEEVPF